MENNISKGANRREPFVGNQRDGDAALMHIFQNANHALCVAWEAEGND